MKINPNEFDIEFIERTQKLIENYDGKTGFTLLINCLLGLIIIPSEYNKNLKLSFLDELLINIPSIDNCLNRINGYIFNPTHRDRNTKKFVSSEKTLGCLLKKMRNGLAHISNTEPINDQGEWVGIKIKDVNNSNNRNIELEITLKYDEIKTIALYISTEYQKEILKI